METIVITHAGQKKSQLGTISLVDKQLVVETPDPIHQDELQNLLDFVTQKPVLLISKNRVRSTSVGNPEYLTALADAITRSQSHIAGQRVRAYVQNDGMEKSDNDQ